MSNLSNKPFTFLMSKGLRNLEDRGGLQYGLRAYLEEFTKEDNVLLVIKINPAYGVPNLLKLFPELTKETPAIRFITHEMTPTELNQLYNECDVFVSPTRAEAFNIPCLEALACGKPVITTNYGGQTDFIDNEVGWLIDYKLVEVENELEYEGIKWATPNHDELKQKMRTSFQSRQVLCQNYYYGKSSLALKSSKKLTWDNTASKIHKLFITE